MTYAENSFGLIRKTFGWMIVTRSSLDILLSLTRVGDGGFSVGVILNVIAIAAAFYCILCSKATQVSSFAAIWVPYIVLLIVSLLYTPDMAGGVRLFMSLLTYPSIFIIALIVIRNDVDYINFLKAAIASSFAPLAIVALQLGGFLLPLDGRISATFGHANIYGFYLNAILFCEISLLHADRRPSNLTKYFLPVYIALTLVVLVMTQARGAWVGAAIMIVAYCLFVNRWLLIIAPVLPIVLLVPSVSSRLSDLSDDSYAASAEQVMDGSVVLNSYAWRQMLWSYAISDSSDARVFGKGVGAFRHNGPAFFPLQASDTQTEGVDAHSGFIQSLYELGVVGLLAYIFLYIGLIILMLRYRADALAYLYIAFVLANLAFNYSDNVLYYLSYNWYAWAIFGADLGRRARLSSRATDRVRSTESFSHPASARVRNRYFQLMGNRIGGFHR